MVPPLRKLARRILGVERPSTYYLPWFRRPGLDCTLVLSNVEARFKLGYNEGPFPVVAEQYDADGARVGRYEVTLRDALDVAEVPLDACPSGHGFGDRLHSDLYVTLSDGETYSATHGRHEWIERYPRPARVAHAAATAVLRLAGRTVAAFQRDQYVYVGADSRSHLLVLNLADVANSLRVSAVHEHETHARMVRIPPLGARLLDVASLVPATDDTRVWRLHLEGNAWFNLYVLGAGPRDLAGPVSLMHVK